jgi:hypothetical protein
VCKNYVLTKESFPFVLPTFALCGVREKIGHDMAGVPPVTAHTNGKIISNKKEYLKLVETSKIT